MATEYHPDAGAGILDRAAKMSEQWSAQGLDLNMADLFYPASVPPSSTTSPGTAGG